MLYCIRKVSKGDNTMTKMYRKTFTNKADAQKFYNSLRYRKNLAGRSCGYLVQEHCYEVTHYYKETGKDGK